MLWFSPPLPFPGFFIISSFLLRKHPCWDAAVWWLLSLRKSEAWTSLASDSCTDLLFCSAHTYRLNPLQQSLHSRLCFSPSSSFPPTKEGKICPDCPTEVVFRDPHEPPAIKFSGFLCLYFRASFKVFYPLLFLLFLLSHQPSPSHFSAPDISPLPIQGSVLDSLLSSVFTLSLVPHIQSHDFTDGVPEMMFQNMTPCVLML